MAMAVNTVNLPHIKDLIGVVKEELLYILLFSIITHLNLLNLCLRQV